jgi:hypothetical protein
VPAKMAGSEPGNDDDQGPAAPPPYSLSFAALGVEFSGSFAVDTGEGPEGQP